MVLFTALTDNRGLLSFGSTLEGAGGGGGSRSGGGGGVNYNYGITTLSQSTEPSILLRK